MFIIRVIDFETTGIDPQTSEVCEVGICDVDVEAKESHTVFSFCCNVATAMPPEARAVHHINRLEYIDKPLFKPEMIGSDCDVYAAHNADFEMKFFTPSRPMICTWKAALRVWPDAPSHSNQALRYWLQDQDKISVDDVLAFPPHRAGPDAYVTAQIVLALLEVVTAREMVGWTKEPALLPRCTIGKFRGKPWAEVDAGFLGWMTRTPDMDYDLVWNAHREIARRQENKL